MELNYYVNLKTVGALFCLQMCNPNSFDTWIKNIAPRDGSVFQAPSWNAVDG